MEEKSPQWEPSFYQAEPGCWAENIGKKIGMTSFLWIAGQVHIVIAFFKILNIKLFLLLL